MIRIERHPQNSYTVFFFPLSPPEPITIKNASRGIVGECRQHNNFMPSSSSSVASVRFLKSAVSGQKICVRIKIRIIVGKQKK